MGTRFYCRLHHRLRFDQLAPGSDRPKYCLAESWVSAPAGQLDAPATVEMKEEAVDPFAMDTKKRSTYKILLRYVSYLNQTQDVASD